MTLPKYLRGRQQFLDCVYCGEHASAFDHVRPKSRGGTDEESNLVPSCHHCNSAKGKLLLSEWNLRYVLFGASQDIRVFVEVLRLTNRYDLLSSGVELTPERMLRKASAALRNPKRDIVLYIIELISPPDHVKSVPEHSDMMNLRRICESGFLSVNYESAKRIRSRAGSKFPRGMRSTAGMIYDPKVIAEWFAENH